MIRVESHPLGPRVYVLGYRVHEVAIGLTVLGLVGLLVALGIVRPGEESIAAVGVGAWLVWKDWRDLVPRWRNTCSHRRFGQHCASGRATRSIAPTLAGGATLGVALAELIAFAAPTSRPGHLAMHLAPTSAHVAALPMVGALLPVAAGLREGRRNAVVWAVGVLGALAIALAAGGHHIDRAVLCLVLACGLVSVRAAFTAEAAPVRARERASAALAAIAGLAAFSWFAQDPHSDLVSGAAGLCCVLCFAVASRLSLGSTRSLLQGFDARATARTLIHRSGSDTLDAFKLRDDARYLTTEDCEALIAYRIAKRVMVVAGDPVGSPDRVPDLLALARVEAARHGLSIAVLNAGPRSAVAWRAAGLRSIYLGDEAIVDCQLFSLEGRPIRKVRQSVSRLAKNGFTAELTRTADLSVIDRAALCRLSDSWRGKAPERGFTMACTLDAAAADDGLVAIARDGDGVPRGLLLLLPAYGRSAYSLALMRRDGGTPNGLMEYLVVDAVERLRSGGVAELSLNFAVLGRCLREGGGWRVRALRWVMRVGDRWFQLERLYRFNDKFFPRWKPRYLMVESAMSTPRAVLSVLTIEGLLPGRSSRSA